MTTLKSGWVTQGPRVEELENRFARRVGATAAVATSNATTALFLSLHAAGLGPGDEVIVPALTYIASVNAITHCGATPVFVDIQPTTYNLDPDLLEQARSPRTRAVMAVHQLGLPADLDAISAFCRHHDLFLLEDAACAVGATWNGKPIGSAESTAVFSFHPRKVLVAGEGGMICTSDAVHAERLRRLRHQGMSVSDRLRHQSSKVIIEQYDEVGFNFRMSDLHAALAIVQLGKLDDFIAERHRLAKIYHRALESIDGLEAVRVPEFATSNWQSYIVRARGTSATTRQLLLDQLAARGVSSRRGLMSCHLEPCYRNARVSGSLEHSERAAEQTFLLPLYNGLDQRDQHRVLEVLEETWREVRR